jgi:hypothetical protein
MKPRITNAISCPDRPPCPPDAIAAEIIENLQEALDAFQSVAEELAKKA